MYTLRDKILDMEISVLGDRIAKLSDIQAPQVILDNSAKLLTEYREGNIKIAGDIGLLNLPYENHTVKTGRGGKQYISFNHGTVNYFPQAHYGKCIYQGR